jgi:metal-responsive CopG/Arc/MetJ family transcriptional regulator
LLKLDEILEKIKINRSELVNFLVKTALSTFQPEKDAASII